MLKRTNRQRHSARRTLAAGLLLAALAAQGFVPAARADLYWDINGADAGASAGNTAAGTWNDSNTNWSTSSAGTAATGVWQPFELAVFSAGTNATGSFTVTVQGTQQISGLRFEEGSVNLSGGILHFDGGATFTRAGGGDSPINSQVQGNGELVLSGSGRFVRLVGVVSDSGGALSIRQTGAEWVFGGQHTYSGGTTITGGIAIPLVNSTGSATHDTLTSGPFGTGTLTLEGGTLRPAAGSTVTIGNAVTLAGNFTFGTGDSSQNIIFTGPLALTGDRTLTFTNSNTFFDGVLSGGFGFTKAGTSTLTLRADNTYTGTTTISAGTLNVGGGGAAGSLGSGNVVNNGSLVVNRTGVLVLNQAISGSGSLTKQGSGTLVLGGNNSYAGATTISAGQLTLTHDNALGSTAGGTTVAGGATLALEGGITVAEPITSIGSGSSVGTILNLSGNNTLTGNITKAGVARFQSDAGLLTIGGNVGGTNNSVYLSGSGDGVVRGDITTGWNVVKEGSGTWTLEGTIGPLDGLLGVSVEGGALRVTRSDVLGSTGVGTTVASGARLELDGGVTVTGETIRIGGDGGSSGSNSGALRSLDGYNVWNGPVILDGPGGSQGTRVGAVNAGSILEIAGVIQNGTQDVVIVRNHLGKTIFSGANTYTGETRLFNGTLELGAHDSLPVGNPLLLGTSSLNAVFDLKGFNQTIGTLRTEGSGTKTITNTGPAASTLTITQNTNQTFEGLITNGTNALNLVKAGAGTLTLTGVNSYTGTTTIDAGVLQMASNLIATSPTIFIGDGARLNVTGGFTLAANQAVTGTGDTGFVTTTTDSGLITGGNNTISSSGTLTITRLDFRGTNNQIAGVGEIQAGGTGNNQRGFLVRGGGDVTLSSGTLRTMGQSSENTHDLIGVGGSATLTIDGGNYVQDNAANRLRLGWSAANDNGTFTINSGSAHVRTLEILGATGSTQIVNLNGGSLRVGNITTGSSTATRTFNFNGGEFVADSSFAIPANLALRVHDGGARIDTNGHSVTVSGNLVNAGTGGLAKQGAGTLTLSGNNTYAGTTTISAGTLALSHGSNNNIAASPLVQVGLGATLDVAGLAGGTFAVAPGQTLAGNGTVAGHVDVLSGGALSPGMSVGMLNLGGNLAFQGGGFFDIDIDDVDLADLVQMDGGLLTPGDATIRVNLGFRPELGDSWTILQGESGINGLFNPDVAMLSGGHYLDGWKWLEVGYGNSVYLTVVPEPGAWLLLLSALAGGLLVRRRR